MYSSTFPITHAQYKHDHITSEGAKNAALLQDLNRNLTVDAAKQIINCANRPITAGELEAIPPQTLHGFAHLLETAMAVCERSEPEFLAEQNKPTLSSLVQTAQETIQNCANT